MSTAATVGFTPLYCKVTEFYLLHQVTQTCINLNITNPPPKSLPLDGGGDFTRMATTPQKQQQWASSSESCGDVCLANSKIDFGGYLLNADHCTNVSTLDDGLVSNLLAGNNFYSHHNFTHLNLELSQGEIVLVGIYLTVSLCGIYKLVQIFVEYLRGCKCRICRHEFTPTKDVASGAFGKVQLATFNGTKKEHTMQVILKHVPVDSIFDITLQQEECKRLLALDHKYVLHYYDDFLHQKFGWNPLVKPKMYCVLVTEYCQRGNLCDLIEQQRDVFINNIEYALELFKQICKAVQYIHDNNVIHRDIKSPNIFVSNGNTIRLGDFGLSLLALVKGRGKKRLWRRKRNLEHASNDFKRRILFDSKERRRQEAYIASPAYDKNHVGSEYNMLVGTDCYMAPEVVENLEYSKASDIWALGCVLFEMSSGVFMWEVGFQLGKYSGRLPQLLQQRLPSTTPSGIKSLLTKMLSKDPKKRPNATQILASRVLRTRCKNNNNC